MRPAATAFCRILLLLSSTRSPSQSVIARVPKPVPVRIGTIRRALFRRACWAVAQLQHGRAVTAGQLAREFEISIRTAYRDFDFLRDEWRLPIAFDPARGTYVLTEPAIDLPHVTVSRGELVALFFTEKLVRAYRGTPFEGDFLSAVRKIEQLMPQTVAVAPDAIDAALAIDLGPVHVPDARVFADLFDALNRRRAVRVRYRSLHSRATTDRVLHPYRVFNHRGDWYVAAWDSRRRAVRDFALHRIERLAITMDPYEIPEEFRFDRYAATAFAIEKSARTYDVVVRFSGRQSPWIRERRWHRTARIDERLDGGCVLRFRASGLGEVARWILQFGADAEAIAPAVLRRRVAQALAEARRMYEARKGS